jgi:hypothetical protein
MNSRLKTAIDFRVCAPVRYAVDLLCGHLEAWTTDAARPVRVLLVSDNGVFTSEQQFAPLLSNRAYLRRHLGVVIHQRLVSDVLASHRTAGSFDLIIAKLSYRLTEGEALETITRLRQMGGTAKLVYFDGDDDSCVQWGRLLETVDLYVKKHVFANTEWYSRTFTGKSNLTDYAARNHGASFDDNLIPHSGSIEPRHLRKLVLGYNIAADEKLLQLFKAARSAPLVSKDVDVVCRAACPPQAWISPFRRPITDALAPLDREYQVLIPNERVSQEQYYHEMRRSRICVSPFGYGEICWRDFEAVILGCMLIKPDTRHIRTSPDIFVPFETYVPVKWDFSDLADTCRRYLSDEPLRRRIAERAYGVLAEFYDGMGFAETVRHMLKSLGLRNYRGYSVQ